jgi:NADH-dependent peroxiredoxin subunit F
MSHVRIYSASWCAYCRAEKQFLDEKGVKYEDIDVEADQAAAQEMVKLSGQMGIPVTVVTHDDKTQELLVGFDPDWLTRQLKLS